MYWFRIKDWSNPIICVYLCRHSDYIDVIPLGIEGIVRGNQCIIVISMWSSVVLRPAIVIVWWTRSMIAAEYIGLTKTTVVEMLSNLWNYWEIYQYEHVGYLSIVNRRVDLIHLLTLFKTSRSQCGLEITGWEFVQSKVIVGKVMECVDLRWV